MDLPVTNHGDIKNSGATSFPCPNCDSDLVHKISQLILPALATAIIDTTTTDSNIAISTRKSMIDYLSNRSSTFFSDLHDSPPDPFTIISNLIEDFTASNRSIFSLFSSWILTDTREEKIDRLVHEMDTNRFWTIDRRDDFSKTLVRNVDYENRSHCAMRFDGDRELEEHLGICEFRAVKCGNEGCKVKVCKKGEREHEGICGYKVLRCDQGCGEMVVRREMDRHCVTVCGMRLMNCPFYQVGCETGIPRCRVEEHCRDEVRRHLVFVLPIVYRDEEMEEGLWEERAKAVEEVCVFDRLS